ncbi:TlpA family protein disulfide reductase [bacterium]|nr:TlpA family protein disulfide reductase [bacterium]
MKRLLLAALALLVAAPLFASEPSPEQRIGLPEHAGEVVYVDFWASWCPPCKEALPWLHALQKDLGEQGFTLITVNMDRDRAAADAFLEKIGATDVTMVHDPDGELATAFGLEALPTSFVYGRDGDLRFKHEGFSVKDAESIADELDELLAEPREEAR